MTRVFVPRDSGALSMGAEAVARAIAAETALHGTPVELIRNGSRGLYWLEPFVEVDTPVGRVAYGPVTEADVPELLRAGFLDGREGYIFARLHAMYEFLAVAKAAELRKQRSLAQHPERAEASEPTAAAADSAGR